MAKSDFEAVIVGGGAAGIAAGRKLHDAGVDCLLLEARQRLGGRAWSFAAEGCPIDLGCGWLHSADRNPWHPIAEAQGRSIDRTPPPWLRPSMTQGFPSEEQSAFRESLLGFHERIAVSNPRAPDAPASTLLESGNSWNALIGAVGTYISGAEPDDVSREDLRRYDDTGVNWRIVEGYGTTITAHAAGVAMRLGCAALVIDHGGPRMKIATPEGTLTADVVVVTLSTDLIAEGAIRFVPELPEKREAATGLPLGLADKLFLALDHADEFPADSRLFGRTDRSSTGVYHFRPFGRPMIEAYFGGTLARDLEQAGADGFANFARSELTGVLGGDFAHRIRPIVVHPWGSDPFARGSYSYAMPGKADCREVLAASVENRLFFAGEACSRGDYSTAHGAYLTGIGAAERIVARLRRTSS